MPTASIQRSHRPGRGYKSIVVTAADVREYADLSRLGINLSDRVLNQMIAGIGLDNNDVGLAPAPLNPLTSPSISTPVQFLQNWLPGFVRVLTAARKIDELIGITTVGSWEDEEVVQGVLEPLGVAVPYGDYTNTPFSSWNTNWERRTVVRFDSGIQVGVLEELRTARIRVSTAAEKRSSSALALDIQRNRVGFYGYNDGSGRTFGFLNDPALPAYVTAPNGASGFPTWATKTFLEITADIRIGLAALQVQSMDTIDPQTTPITMAVPTSVYQYLTVTAPIGGYSVRKWVEDNYPNLRIISAPELNDANGGVTAAYFFADEVIDGASDDSRTFVQVVPAKFQALGVEKRAKSYIEEYSNATAGTMLKRPYAVYRMSGI